jgi:hypothetical protein
MKAREAAGAVPDDLVRLVRGFQESRVVLTGLEGRPARHLTSRLTSSSVVRAAAFGSTTSS